MLASRILRSRTTWSRSYAKAATEGHTSTHHVRFTLATPVESFYKNASIDSVVIPGIEGNFEVMPNLSPVITELKAGLVTVFAEGTQKKFFVSGGFAFVHPDSSCSCNAVECIEIENIDVELARKAMATAQNQLAVATTDVAKAVAQIQYETAHAIVTSIAHQ
eukprot:TRINITY_DN2099_c0_g1_i1.p1 TRINITY_DN2099_c0_g1~~TRINITY_DN2099_c0_g1_i1.p1  ORF type:complete len:179 (-),score=31.11 TRINITY_DN2099_c0_g1_i1:85-573(-)